MVIHDPDFVRLRPLPLKDETPALVDSHAIVALEIPLEALEAVPWWGLHVQQAPGRVQHIKLLQRRPENLGRVSPDGIL
jgi:hypothetical protein